MGGGTRMGMELVSSVSGTNIFILSPDRESKCANRSAELRMIEFRVFKESGIAEVSATAVKSFSALLFCVSSC